MNNSKSVSFRPDDESVRILDSVQNKSAAINAALHLYSSGKLPDLQQFSAIFCGLQLAVGRIDESQTACEIKERLNELCRCLKF